MDLWEFKANLVYREYTVKPCIKTKQKCKPQTKITIYNTNVNLDYKIHKEGKLKKKRGGKIPDTS